MMKELCAKKTEQFYSFLFNDEVRDKLRREFLEIRGGEREITFSANVKFLKSGFLANVKNLYTIGVYSRVRTASVLLSVIGNYSGIASGVKSMNNNYECAGVNKLKFYSDGNNHIVCDDELYFPRLGFNYSASKLTIDDDVWIGQDVILSSNIKIATGAIVAAGSVVFDYVPPYAIVGGNPAKIIKYRFEDKIIEQLLETRWTEYDIAPMEINGDIPVENFIEEFYNYRDKGLIKPIVLKNLKQTLDQLGIEYNLC